MYDVNFAVIFRSNKFPLAIEKLSSIPCTRLHSHQGWTAILGWFNESDIEGYEHYSSSLEGETLIGWKDIPL